MKNNKVLLLGAVTFIILLMFPAFASGQGLFTTAEDLIISFEGFMPVSKWDYKQYSWGYGTRAPGPGLPISEGQARNELRSHIQNDYDYLSPLITRPLKATQWAPLLSFSYNEGPGNADNLIANINSGDDNALQVQWNKYIYVHDAAGNALISDDLRERRASEWAMWVS